MTDVEIRDARGPELVAGCELLARSLGFADRDALPPWLVQTAAQQGGLALGAFSEEGLIAFSAAIPTGDGALFSCGLAVAPSHRGRGIARQLKLLQRERALARGCARIRWTADPLSASALALYLPGLGARLVDYGIELYAAVRQTAIPPDDVTIDWALERRPPAAASQATASVEIPFDHRVLREDELLGWRLRVRRAMRRALEQGAVGTGVAIDRSTRRAWVLFSQGA